MFYYEFNLSAGCVIALVIFYYYAKKRLPVIQNRIFIYMAWAAFLSCVLDLIFSILSQSPGCVPIWLMNLILVAYFILRDSLPFLFAIYTIALTDTLKTIRRWIKIFLLAEVLIVGTVLLTSPITGFIFYFDEGGIYRRGPGMPILHLFALLTLFFCLVYVVLYRHVLGGIVRYSIYGFVWITVGASVIQLIFPNLMVEAVGVSLCILMIYMNIQRPEEYLDALTGLWNQSAFYSMAYRRMHGKNRFRVLIVEIMGTDFYRTNFGIGYVDKILKNIADDLQQFSSCAWIYYVGDNRFYLVENSKEGHDFKDMVAAAYQMFSGGFQVNEDTFRLHVHLGVFRCPEDADALERLLDYADCMAVQEHEGEVKVFHAADLNMEKLLHKKEVERALQYAVEHKTFQIYYQPILDTQTGRFASAEALIRLTDEKLGPISPEEFIPAAERNGMIQEIGAYVLEQVCRFLAQGGPQKLGISYVEVNLSVVQGMDARLVERVQQTLHRYGIEPGLLNFEITETAAAHSTGTLKRNMEELAALGITFSMDDYGTGYSNMNALLELPFKIVKLDKSVVWKGLDGERNRKVLESLIAMVKKIDLRIVAEGVEDEGQARELIGMGCDYLQGYHYSRPVPEDEFLLKLKS